jgi:hypothetical protein
VAALTGPGVREGRRGQLALELLTVLSIYVLVVGALAVQYKRHRDERREEVYRQRPVDEAERVASAMNPFFATGRLNRTLSCDRDRFTYWLGTSDSGPTRYYVGTLYDTGLRHNCPLVLAWANVPGSDDERLRSFFSKTVGLGWVLVAGVDGSPPPFAKASDGESVRVQDDLGNWAEVRLERDRSSARLVTSDGRERRLVLRDEQGAISVYHSPYEGYAPLQLDPPADPLVRDRIVRASCEGKTMTLCIDAQQREC